MSFRSFILAHRYENSPEGDLARDLLDDTCAKCLSSYKSIRKHMVGHNACDDALYVLDALFKSWEATQDS